MTIPIPQDTGCTSIEIATGDDDRHAEGVTNGILSMIADYYEVEYDEGRNAYVVGERMDHTL